MFLALLKKPDGKKDGAEDKIKDKELEKVSEVSTKSYAQGINENINIALPDSNSINENILARERAPFLQKIRSGSIKKAPKNSGDDQSDFWSHSISYFDKRKLGKGLKSNTFNQSGKSKKSKKSDPITKLLGGGFKQIRKNKALGGGMTIINFKTDIDHPDPERVRIHNWKPF